MAAGDEFELPGCRSTVLAGVLFGIPCAVLFLTVAIGFAYGTRDRLVLAHAAVLGAGLALFTTGLARERLVPHGVVFAALAAVVVVSGTVLGG